MKYIIKIVLGVVLFSINTIEGRKEGVYFVWEWGQPCIVVAPINEKIGPLQVVYIDGEGTIHQDFPFVIIVDPAPAIVDIIIEKIAGKNYVYLSFRGIATNLVLTPRLTGVPPVGGVFVYPNPWKKRQGGGIVFKGFPRGSVIRIFNIAGEQIIELYPSPNDDELYWPVPETLASGVYIYLITNDNGDKIVTGKIGIIK